MVTRTDSIINFLKAYALPDLAELYNYNMEVQVNVAQDGGDRIDGEYQGRQWLGWTDGIEQWKSFRIPYNANTEPSYEDKKMTFDLAKHAEGIGMTGWDWKNQVSRWVAFDFDAITGHSEKHGKKLTDAELKEIRDAVSNIPWVTVRQSTGGKGLHFYIKLNNVVTKNHNEHAALARSILAKLSAVTGFDFTSKVDVVGGNMWVWHRKMRGTQGLTLIKEGGTLHDIPSNWKDHLTVVSGRKKKIVPSFISDSQSNDIENLFDELCGQRPRVPLDDEHKALINYLDTCGASWWFDTDHHMLVCHTWDLLQAHAELSMRGVFKTIATGRDHGADHNVWMFPMRRGAWVVRRYTPGCQEVDTWEQDGNGWTTCYLNQEPDLRVAARCYGGVEREQGGFLFYDGKNAIDAALMLGVNLKVPTWAYGRSAELRKHKDGRLIIEFEHRPNDPGDGMEGWQIDRKKWKRIFSAKTSAPREQETGNYDDVIRHLITEAGEDFGWVIKGEDGWRFEPLAHVRIYLGSLGLNAKEVNAILGSSVARPWTLVNRPFQPEYIGDRNWNKNAAQFRFVPSETEKYNCPSWNSILNHIGSSLDNAVKNDGWCKINGIISGAEYLKCWLASMFKEPTEPLPYLFLYGNQKSGKSILHEALELLVTSGIDRAENALISQNGFNAEIENAILCIVEETDLNRNRIAYNRIKDWVTARKVSIHRKGSTPYSVINTTHWIQIDNSSTSCPVFPGDTRIVYIHVQDLDPIQMVPKKKLLVSLEKEAPDFLASILNLELPETNDRLNIPVITTSDKLMAEKANRSMLEIYIEDHCQYVPGEMVKFGELYDRFKEWLDPNQIDRWSKIRVGRELPQRHPKGRAHGDGQFYVGNLAFEHKDSTKPLLIVEGDYLEHQRNS
jgi:hypothetical protein